MRIIAAAVRINGLTVSKPPPSRHHHLLNALPPKMARSVLPLDQGFLTDEGKFLRRKSALAVAREAGQLLKETDKPELYSEDLW